MSESDDILLESEVQRELENLFALQGKTLTDRNEAIWMQEIRQSNIPMKAVLLGIKQLKSEDMQKLTFSAILGAARRYMEFEQIASCPECHNGTILMKDAENRPFSLACKCSAGIAKAHAQHLVFWNGESSQMLRGRMLTR